MATSAQPPPVPDTRLKALAAEPPAEHFILTVHGIRTFGQWQERLGALLGAAGSPATVEHFHYGVFSVLAYMVPFLRWIRVLQFRRYLAQLASDHPGARIDVV